VRADLSFYETAAGGAVFATGSIAWCGSLPCNGYENNISRITLNALKRFMDPKPFV
jgi:N,N-dimethylformamidase